ncbi:hypothetical protein ZYGR_0S02330 [Zygosaccharomyces rouxii]|uniref:ZYRO0F07722p n=2 Tax=Zygosaccharomyces rouxii TaxID=4956 RepID=C5DXT8_ZYGRC|nr:uncharacterized protein ZYRO0F07722g [Zygosaccharomyces rouxii]GAV50099.1 hypothetical protein ZYGR_0S02330 [Zygosaccharomyces rouxii]CAR28599.1 ZYRO0F07722p [Zygosaccharomyces rouxii]
MLYHNEELIETVRRSQIVEEMDLMGPISDLFQIQHTPFGGRACFSNTSLPRGTVVLDAEDSLGESISYEFRKEVCHYCLLYDNGKVMKCRINASELEPLGEQFKGKRFQGAGLWFCSPQCRDEFLRQDHILELISGYESLLNGLLFCQKRGSDEDIDEEKLNSIPIDQQTIEFQWQQLADEWIPRVQGMKPSKKLAQLPHMTDDIYCCARSICRTLFQLKYLDPESVTNRSFQVLQSNELSKTSRFPILLSFQIAVYQTLYILLPPTLHSQLSIPKFRHILGAEYGNAFGIWQMGESVGDREYLGYWLFPRASFFNHSCDPNVDKVRKGRKMCFILNRDVTSGTQLCIAYNCDLTLPVSGRQQTMKDNWFFECMCDRCSSELQTVH